MKAKLVIASLVGLCAANLAFAQNETPAAEPATPPADPAPPAVEPAAPAPTPEAATPATAAPVELSPSATVIPLIQFQDVPLTTAIDNLARQAGINYILDPRVGYGQPDERGVVKVQPNISIRWENITAEQALNALIATYGLQLVTDSKTAIARVTIRDPAAADPLKTQVIQLKYASPSNAVNAVTTVLTDKRSKVIADVRTSQLVVSATEREHEAVAKLVEQLDLRTKQVLIEAKILETTLNPRTAKGVDWSGTLARQNITYGNNVSAPAPIDSLGNPLVSLPYPKTILPTAGNPAPAFLNADGVAAAVSFLNSSGDTRVVSEPRVVTLDNQKSKIDVGLLYPIVNVTASTANTTGGSEISYTNLTINLEVTPRIAANNQIELRVQQGVLRLGGKISSVVSSEENLVDSFLTRQLDTTVLIPSGNTLVMGGLVQDQNRNESRKVPILGDIPGLGFFFRWDSKELDRQNLTIFLTPTVVNDTDFQPAQSTYLQTTGNEVIREDWSWWDSGKRGGDQAPE
jgi:type II secretory pathway component GspD/PulD (secretin)